MPLSHSVLPYVRELRHRNPNTTASGQIFSHGEGAYTRHCHPGFERLGPATKFSLDRCSSVPGERGMPCCDPSFAPVRSAFFWLLVLWGRLGLRLPPPQGPSQSLSDPPQNAEANKAIRTPSGKAGKEEPSSHTPTTTLDDTHVLVNGSLAVPGAPTETETTPAKYSKKNAADDKLITVAYTFKALPNDQRQAIYLALKNAARRYGPGYTGRHGPFDRRANAESPRNSPLTFQPPEDFTFWCRTTA